MKSLTKKLFVLGGVFLMGMSLASCGISKSDADKINEAAKNGEAMTYDELVKKYGDPTTSLLVAKTGYAIWVNGCDTMEKVQEKWDAGKDVSALGVLVVLNKATSATFFDSFSKDDLTNFSK